jgi:hypothetical protein
MYNSNTPNSQDLPSTAKLIKSTILAIIGAGVLLVTVVMPSEYGIDPTGMGRLLGLTDMGEIKTSLAEEAAADALAHAPQTWSESETVEEESADPTFSIEVFEETIETPIQHGHHHGDGSYHQH